MLKRSIVLLITMICSFLPLGCGASNSSGTPSESFATHRIPVAMVPDFWATVGVAMRNRDIEFIVLGYPSGSFLSGGGAGGWNDGRCYGYSVRWGDLEVESRTVDNGQSELILGQRTWNLQNGRVFLMKEHDHKDQIEVRQIDVELPRGMYDVLENSMALQLQRRAHVHDCLTILKAHPEVREFFDMDHETRQM